MVVCQGIEGDIMSAAAAGAAHAIGQLAQIPATASLKHTVHIGMVEMLGMPRKGKFMADHPYLDDFAKRMLDEIVWQILNPGNSEPKP
jgi:hypothetical protein